MAGIWHKLTYPSYSTHPADMSSARTSRPATTSRIAAHIHGVTRTASGTLISNHTRHPTPEPSDAGSQDAEIEDMVFDHIQNTLSMTSSVDDEDVHPDSQRRRAAIEMSQSSPNLMDYTFERGTELEMSKKHLEEVCTRGLWFCMRGV